MLSAFEAVVTRSPRILHVTEAYGGGVASALDSYLDQTPELEHGLAYAVRPEARPSASLLERFSKSYDLQGRTSRSISQLRGAIDAFNPDILHAHSSYGGLYARVAASKRRVPIVYSPHCYAYLREDYRKAKRTLFKFAEIVQGINTSVYACCSLHETKLAGAGLFNRPSLYIPNIPPATTKVALDATPTTLVGIGRVNYQKDPEFFAEAARYAMDHGLVSKAIWIGDGESAPVNEIRQRGITVTGWLPRNEVMQMLTSPGSIYLHSARWEGFPISVLEAHAARVPVIIRKTQSFDGFQFPNYIHEPTDIGDILLELQDATYRSNYLSMADEAFAAHTATAQREALRNVYGLALQARSPRKTQKT